MQIFEIKSEEDLLALNKKIELENSGCVAALGFFDGVHVAHRALISEAKLKAKELALPLVIFTFSAKNTSFKSEQIRLLTNEEKTAELSSLGADFVLIFDFDLIKNLSADDFAEKILLTILNTHTAFCGFNFKFGKGALGNTDMLCNKLKAHGREVVVFSEYKVEGKTVSSSFIRELLSENKLNEAAKILGKPFFIDGKVAHGLGLGKKLGIPTVNLDIKSEKFAPKNGVYYTAAVISGNMYSSLTNIGNCPTFDEREIHSETFILNFDENLYDADIRVYFLEYLRPEIKFSSKEELILQINIDKNRALELEKEIKWQEIGLNLP